MMIWKKIKKYFLADLTTKQDYFSLGNWEERMMNESNEQSKREMDGMPQIENKPNEYGTLSSSLNLNIDWIKEHFSFPQSHGLVVRRMAIGQSSIQAAVIYMDGLVSWNSLNRTVLSPLMGMYLPSHEVLSEEYLVEHILTEGQISIHDQREKIIRDILIGLAVVLVEGLNKAVIVGIQGWEKKALDNPKTEMVVRGSQVGFTEDIQTNLTIVRRRLPTPELIVEMGQVGTISRTDIAMIYIKSIANEDLVREVRERIAAIDYDYIGDSGMVEQLIEDHPNSFFPSVLSTERPDRLSAQVAEGYVGIIVNNSPFGLVVPAHFPLFLQTAEDANLRWPYGTFIRIIRQIGYFMSLYLPAFYVAIANYHMEMIPTTLILAIAGTRETVPLPVAAESVLLECMFELIREAGVRIPGVIGPTIGIVGALILGQAAVQANIVSPIVVIITATTALASYTIPNYNLQFATRILRFVYLFVASAFGLVGIVVMWLILLANRVSSNSFGVPVLSPMSPHLPSNDSIIRTGMRLQKYRSLATRPKREWRLSKEEDQASKTPNTNNQEEVLK